MILTVTLNPAIDLFLELDGWHFGGEVNRAHAVRRTFAGKGINVSRGLHLLGLPTTALTLIGADTEAVVTDLIQQEGFRIRYAMAVGETRTNIHILNLPDHNSLKVNQNGTPPGEALKSIRGQFDGAIAGSKLLVLAGSLPPETPHSIYGDLAVAASALGVPTVIDAEGGALLDSLAARPFLVKPNRQELATTLRKKLPSQQDLVQAARELQIRGAQNVVVTDGGHPTLVLTKDAEFYVIPPTIRVVHPTGAGDAFTAGLVAGLSWGWSLGEAARLGNALGATACLGIPHDEWSAQIERLLPQTRFEPI